MRFNFIKEKKFVLFLLAIIVLSSFYVCYRFYKVCKNIELLKETIGYKTPCKYLNNKVFKRGKWQGVLIDADISLTDGAHNLIPYDLDSDGNKELIANSYRSDALIIYKYKNDPCYPSNWSRYIIDSSVGGGIPRRPIIKFFWSIIKEKLCEGFIGGAHFTAISDMDGDGRYDLIIAGDLKKNDVIWYKTPNEITDISSWKKNIAYKNDSHRTYHVETGDIDGDGYQDIVFATKTDKGIGWLKNCRSSDEWPLTWIDDNFTRSFNIRVDDIDKNEQNDIVVSKDDSINGGEIRFYNYSARPTFEENWTGYLIAKYPKGHGVSVFEIVDIDRDDDLDIVTANHQGDIYILENPYPQNIYREWNKYKINNYNINDGHDFREIDIGDIDNDKDLDIIIADEGKNMVAWFENSGFISYKYWKEHIIDESDQYLRWCHCVELGDIDGDGDLDVVVAAAGSNAFLLYINNLKEKIY